MDYGAKKGIDFQGPVTEALEAKVAQDGVILTEAQLAALEKAKSEKEAHGEFERWCNGPRLRPKAS